MNRECPSCYGAIHAKAKRCRHCGELVKRMNKGLAAGILVGGIVLVLIGAGMIGLSANVNASPRLDGFYDTIKYSGVGVGVVGIVGFFVGAMQFSKR